MKIQLLILIILLFRVPGAWAQKTGASATEDWSRKPVKVSPAKNGAPPSDAIVLFTDEKDLAKWEHPDGSPVKWQVKDNTLVAEKKTGNIRTKQGFGSVQLHVEWKTPDPKEDQGTNRGNSGVFLMDLYELQIYESYSDEHPIYYNGMAGSVYKQHTPLVNPTYPPQTWQTFDIIFNAPEFNPDKSLKKPAYMTVFLNDVLILNQVELKGPMKYEGPTQYTYHEAKLPIRLQEHGSRVSFRNIWVREL